MTIDELIGFGSSLDGVLTLRPGPGDGTPEIAWGDVFFYYAPDQVVPQTTQPFTTIVTKDYPGDEQSRLSRPGVFRVNIAAGRSSFRRWTNDESTKPAPDIADEVIEHPVYGAQGWLAVVNPGRRTETVVRELITEAHALARARAERRNRSRP